MFEAPETHSLDDFLSDPQSHVSRLRETKAPETLIVKGGSGLVVQDAESYGELMDELERARFVQSLLQSRKNYQEGKSIPLEEAEAILRARHGF